MSEIPGSHAERYANKIISHSLACRLLPMFRKWGVIRGNKTEADFEAANSAHELRQYLSVEVRLPKYPAISRVEVLVDSYRGLVEVLMEVDADVALTPEELIERMKEMIVFRDALIGQGYTFDSSGGFGIGSKYQISMVQEVDTNDEMAVYAILDRLQYAF